MPNVPEFKAGEILVKFKASAFASAASAASKLKQYNATYIRALYSSDVQLWQVTEGQELALVEQLNADPSVEYAEPNYIYRAFGTPDDPHFAKQWAHTKIQSVAGWDISTGSTATVIAIIDTGIDETHPDLASKIVAGYDFWDSDANPHDLNGHGTHVAGIAAAATNNGTGVAGVDWQARIMPVRVLNAEGSGYSSDITDGITWAYQHGADVINLSLGGTLYSQSMQNAVNAAHAAGSLVVAAMGNCRTYDPPWCPSANPTNYPAAYSNVMAVAATGPTDQYTYYSQYGSHCDIAAPGGEMTYLHDPDGIYSTLPTYQVDLNTEGYSKNYDYLQGTSQAAPHVAGLAALVWSVDSGLTPDEVQTIIQDSADDLGSSGWDVNYGYGRINALAALQTAGMPSVVMDLRATDSTLQGNKIKVTLRWSAPSNADTVAVRYSSAHITEANWASATLLTDSLAGSATNYLATVSYSGSGVIYFALKAQGAGGVESALSNNAFAPARRVFLPLIRK